LPARAELSRLSARRRGCQYSRRQFQQARNATAIHRQLLDFTSLHAADHRGIVGPRLNRSAFDRDDFLRASHGEAEIDARGLLCPLPVLKARKALLAMAPGAVLCLLADDAMAIIDVPHFCTETGHVFLDMTQDDGFQTYLIRRAP